MRISSVIKLALKTPASTDAGVLDYDFLNKVFAILY
jgi:hypothetical protein